MLGSLFKKSCSPKGQQTRYFEKISEWLFLFTVSMVHCCLGLNFQGLDCMQVQVTDLVFCRSSFLFLSCRPELSPDRHSKTYKGTIDKSIKFLNYLFLVVLDGFRFILDRLGCFRLFQMVFDCFSLFLTSVSTLFNI